MKIAEFYENICAHEDLKGIGISEDAVVIKHAPTGIRTQMGIDAIADNDWDTLEAVLTTKREPEALYHMARVVGYYSRVENWNPSKLGELKDRKQGDYAV